MERQHRAFTQDDKDFKELFCVKKEVFIEMYEILRSGTEKEDDRPNFRWVISCFWQCNTGGNIER